MWWWGGRRGCDGVWSGIERMDGIETRCVRQEQQVGSVRMQWLAALLGCMLLLWLCQVVFR